MRQIAGALFRTVEVLYLALDREQLIISETQPDHRVVVLARSVDQVRRYSEAILRGDASAG